MKTQLLMSVSAIFMFIFGIGLTFLPQEALIYVGIDPMPIMVLMLQVAGALYFGFAILNWMARANLIGGIYGRSVATGNLVHFLVVAIALLRYVIGHTQNAFLILVTAIYVVLAIWFGLVVFTHPIKATQPN